MDRGVYVQRLDELRAIRNDITHVNPDPVPEDAVDKHRHVLGSSPCSRLRTTHEPANSIARGMPTSVSSWIPVSST